MTDTAALLDELRTLRKRPRADARRYAPPLLVFGLLIIAATVLYRPSGPSPEYFTSMDSLGGNGLMATDHPGLIVAYWFAVLIGGTAFTTWWYHLRATRQGIELRTRPQLMAAGAALLGILVGGPTLQAVLGPWYWPELHPVLHPVLVAVGILGAIAVLAWSARPTRTPGARAAGLVAGFVLAMLGVGALEMYLYGYLALGVIAAVVFAMAWVERSRWVGGIAVAFTVASLICQISSNNLYDNLGWYAPLGSQAHVLQDLLTPALVLVIGGLGGLAAGVVRRVAR